MIKVLLVVMGSSMSGSPAISITPMDSLSQCRDAVHQLEKDNWRLNFKCIVASGDQS